MKKKTYALVAALIVALSLLGVVIAKIYWTRSLTRSLTVIGIEAELLQPDAISYRDKVVATELVGDKVFLTIYAENFYNVWLNLTWTTDAEGLDVNVEGQYFRVLLQGGNYNLEYLGDPFDCEGYNVVDKTQMMWNFPDANVLDAYGLELRFEFDTELVTTPGDYTCDLTFEMGFV